MTLVTDHRKHYEVNSRCQRPPERVVCLRCGEVFAVDNNEIPKQDEQGR